MAVGVGAGVETIEGDVERAADAGPRRRAAQMAVRFAALSAPAVVAATVAIGWIYAPYTEFDRPSFVAVIPFLGSVGLWSLGAAVWALPHDPRPSGRALGAGALLVAAVVVAAIAFAPDAPLRQAAWALAATMVLPNAVWATLAFPGVAMLAVRAVVAGIGAAMALPVVAVLVIISLSRSLPLIVAAGLGALLVHLPVTGFPSSIGAGRREHDGRGVPMVASGAIVLAVVVAGAGLVAKPAAPAESDPLLAEVAAAHRDLNAAVGWDSWRPNALTPTAARLERAAALSGGDAPELLEAVERVRAARAHDDRESAVIAHRIVAGFELKVRESRAFVRG